MHYCHNLDLSISTLFFFKGKASTFNELSSLLGHTSAEGQDLHCWKDHPERRKLHLPRKEVRQEGPSNFLPEPKAWAPAASQAESLGPWPRRRDLFLFSVGTPHFLCAGEAVCEPNDTIALSCSVFIWLLLFLSPYIYTALLFLYVKQK